MDREKSRGGLRIPSHTLTIIYGITGLLHYESPLRSGRRKTSVHWTLCAPKVSVQEPCVCLMSGQGVT